MESSPSLSQRLKGLIPSPTARRKKQRSPKPRRATPPRPEPEQTWSNGEGLGSGVRGDGREGDEAPLLPERSYTPDDMGLEDAPPLPERNYSWSEMEDNDDEVRLTPSLTSLSYLVPSHMPLLPSHMAHPHSHCRHFGVTMILTRNLPLPSLFTSPSLTTKLCMPR